MLFIQRCRKACAAVYVAAVFAFVMSAQGADQSHVKPTFQFKDARTPAESADSIKLLQRALELSQAALGADDPVVAGLAYRLAQRYDDVGDYGKALTLYE